MRLLASFPSPRIPMAIDSPINVKSLRALKNSVIGNPSAKASLAQNEAFVRVSVFNPLKQRLVKEVDDIGSLAPVSSVVLTNPNCMPNANLGHPRRPFGSRLHMLSRLLPTVSQPGSLPSVNHTNSGRRDPIKRTRGPRVVAASQRSPGVLIRALKLYPRRIDRLQGSFHPRATRSRCGICRVRWSFTVGPQTGIVPSAA